MTEEIWKDVPGYEGTYQVSNIGNVKSVRRNNSDLTKSLNNSGYVRVSIRNKKVFSHRLVALTFIPNPENKPCVNHKDGNKLNNNSNNLEWASYSENSRHAFDIGLYNKKSAENLENHVSEIRKPIISKCLVTGNESLHKSIKDCAKFLNRTRAAVSRAARYGSKCNNHVLILKTNQKRRYGTENNDTI